MSMDCTTDFRARRAVAATQHVKPITWKAGSPPLATMTPNIIGMRAAYVKGASRWPCITKARMAVKNGVVEPWEAEVRLRVRRPR